MTAITSTISSSDRAKLRRQLRRAVGSDPDLGLLIDRIGYPEPRKRDASFETLLQIIVSQQISTRAAAAVFAKLRRHCRGEVTWRKVLNREPVTLRECGLSMRKAEYAHGLAEMFQSGQLDMQVLARSTTEEVIDKLIAVRGFGRWSAEIFAMFSLDRKDLYPADDLALQIALQRYLGLETKPGGPETAALAVRWSPNRTAVALLMWKFYGAATLDVG